jgi:hypothetical protein
MNLVAILLALTATTTLLVAGYAFGARHGRAARATLEKALEGERECTRVLTARLSTPASEPPPAGSDVRAAIEDALAPLLTRERVARDLAAIRFDRTGLGGLPAAVDAIAETGGFQTVVLSDDAGLPLAASAHSGEIEVLAAAAAYLEGLAQRAVRSHLPRPVACVLLDDAQRTTVHRMFALGSERFTLSAVARGAALFPSALDAALPALERALAPQQKAG